jgi:hypothetical protein
MMAAPPTVMFPLDNAVVTNFNNQSVTNQQNLLNFLRSL